MGSDTTSGDSSSSDELRAVSPSFQSTTPLAGRRMETLRSALTSADQDGTFVRNSNNHYAIRWSTRRSGPLSASERTSLVKAAYTFAVHDADPSLTGAIAIRSLTALTSSSSDLSSALDAVGLGGDADDARTKNARAALEDKLAAAASLSDVSVYKGKLPGQGLDWQGVMAVVDQTNQEVLFEVGGFGN